MRPAAVLFDCDGVLVDSEAVANGAVAEDLSERGWPLTTEAAKLAFMGTALPDMVPRIEHQLGRKLPPDWPRQIVARIIARYDSGILDAIPGAEAAVEAVAAAGLPMAVASNSGRDELRNKAGIFPFFRHFGGRLLCFEDVARPKPHPDLYLAAAKLCGADPRDCVVIEDSVTGARAGLAAGCRVLGFAHETLAIDLLEAGVKEVFTTHAALPGLLGIAPAGVAA
ncbi:haloacid dehalogenase superfamily, subfamily IA, variant 3 with third motif having DD or ED [Roseomonas rosea]|uniref:Haloacid dehalogenase superfamily, subfamily IA, variant 3 with third motif having DD or ED n=1 Tax=Muricoccus roseus TaxID=198092 RepID=A0A1M6FS94_9PROT|nr:HAD family phosphatase [Roseomonas rosea]SHJ00547.1 haloacid dehalogenase superfamily, subfamily IA, variant 3 with third motif having DD or ED [Roseomonas rosea]